MNNRRGLIMGVVNNKSIAWSIAKKMAENGAILGFSYRDESIKKRIQPLTKDISDILIKCDVAQDKSIEDTFTIIKNYWGKLDFIVHSIAFANKDELQGKYMMTSRNNFCQSLNISCYSLAAICKYAYPLMSSEGTILTFSYYGAEKFIPNYNLMGVAKAALETSIKYLAHDLGDKNIRINAISSGPIKTLSSSVIKNFKHILKHNLNNTPLKRSTSHVDVANASLYLLSKLSSGVTGEIHHVDCGYNTSGVQLNNVD